MKCFYHEKKDAVATCQNCGKGLCKTCASKQSSCLCEECIKDISKNEAFEKAIKKQQAIIDTKEEFIAAIIKGILAVLIGMLILNVLCDYPFDTSEFMLFFFPFGWALITYLEQYLPPMLVSGLLYFIYLIFKITFSFIFGIFCFAYQVVKFIIKMIYHKKNNNIS